MAVFSKTISILSEFTKLYSVTPIPAAERFLACWVCRFESCRGHNYFCLVSVFFLSARGLCEGPILRSEDSYRLFRVTVRDLELSNGVVLARVWAVAQDIM